MADHYGKDGRSLPSGTATRLLTGTLDMQEDGSEVATALWHVVPRLAAAGLTPRRRGVDRHPDYPLLTLVSRRIEDKENDTALVTCTYRGFTSADPEEEEDLNSDNCARTANEEPIETHPMFANVSQEDLITIREAINNPVPNQSPALTDSAAISLYTKLLRGQTSYKRFGVLFRRVRVSRSKPSAVGVGKIRNAPGGPTLNSGENYLRSGLTWRRTGNIYQWSDEYISSGAGGWDPDLYS